MPVLSQSEAQSYEQQSIRRTFGCLFIAMLKMEREKINSKHTHALLLSHLEYDPDTGNFVRLICLPGCGSKPGDVAGYKRKNGYVVIRFNGKQYRAHRLAWFYVHGEWPDGEIDHINGVKSDNRLRNLRIANRSENTKNIGRRRRNTTGFKGVSKVTGMKSRWCARITSNRETIHIGSFSTPEEAYDAYCKKAAELHGVFSNTDNNPAYLSEECASLAIAYRDPNGFMTEEDDE
ncbi:HNH endonuclease [Enterobacter cloacae complex sp. 2024EL-00215]